MMTTLLTLIAAHFLCDYSLQSDYIAKNKSPIVNPKEWTWVMTAHCAIHGLAVGIITGNAVLGILEFVLHFVIDDLKCMGKTNLHVDQCLHILCKVLWAFLITYCYTAPIIGV